MAVKNKSALVILLIFY